MHPDPVPTSSALSTLLFKIKSIDLSMIISVSFLGIRVFLYLSINTSNFRL